MSQKDDVLSRLSDRQLLEMARSVQGDDVRSDTSRNDLIKIVKGSLSLDEIKQRSLKARSAVAQQNSPDIKIGGMKIGAIAQVFLVIWSIALAAVNVVDSYISSTIPFFTTIQSEALLSIPVSLILIIFAFLDIGAMAKMRSALSGNRIGMIGGIVALFASLTGTLNYGLTYLGLTVQMVPFDGGTEEIATLAGIITPFLYDILLGLAMLFVGLFFLVNRKRFANDDLWLATGIVFLIIASSQFGLIYVSYLSLVIQYNGILIGAGAMGAACFMSQ